MEAPILRWRPVPGFEEYYAVSSAGDIIGVAPRAQRGRGSIVGKKLKLTTRRDGYSQVTLRVPGRRKTVKVHAVVCEAFHGPAPTSKHKVAHWNGIRSDCTESNVRWATRSGNQRDRARHGTHTKGSRHQKAKLTESDIPLIKAMRRNGMLHREIADAVGVHKTTVTHILRGDIWRHV